MPRIRLTKSAIDALPTSKSDVVYWDAGYPGFGVKVTPKGRKAFIVLYRTGGAGSRLRKYTIGPHGRVTFHQARVAAQKVFAAKLDGRDLAAEKRAARQSIVADRVEDLLEAFIAQRLSQNRSGGEVARLLRREIGKTWAGKSIHEINKRDVVEVVMAIEQRGAPVAANKALKSVKTFLRWCVGRAVLDQSPAEGVPLPAKESDSAAKRSRACSGRNSSSCAEFGRFRNHGPRTLRPTSSTCPTNRWPCSNAQTRGGHMSFLCSEPSPSRNSVGLSGGWISSRE
jgi:Arm DNA-binding domain